MQVFTTRSVTIGIVAGVLIALAVTTLDAPWGLAIPTGLAGGAFALAVSTMVGDGRFGFMTARGRPGIRMLATVVILFPALSVSNAIEVVELARAESVALTLMVLLTGAAAHALGGILATLDHVDD